MAISSYHFVFQIKKDRLVTMRKLKSSLQADSQKYEAYIANLESHSSSITQKSKGITDMLEAVGKDKVLILSNFRIITLFLADRIISF